MPPGFVTSVWTLDPEQPPRKRQPRAEMFWSVILRIVPLAEMVVAQ